MTEDAKIWLSEEEQVLVNRTDWILTKHRVIGKVYQLMGNIQQRIAEELKNTALLDGQYPVASAKISKGENYQGLPYVILDYPAIFQKSDILALRTLFWWGNFFSVTLQLSGRYLDEQRTTLLGHQSQMTGNGYMICMGDDPWQHHLEADNYRPAGTLTTEAYSHIIMEKPFFKITKAFTLNENWETMATHLSGTAAGMARLLAL